MRAAAVAVLFVIAQAGCAAQRAAPRAVPPGDGWVCGAMPDGARLCVRHEDECTRAATGCSRHDIAHCFTWVGSDDVEHFACKPTSSECDARAARFAKDEREVSRCEPHR